MDVEKLLRALDGLHLGPVRYFPCIGSTNEEAARWAEAGAPDLSLVVADEQTSGRGRMGRRWYTLAGAGLAFSLVMHPERTHLQDSKNYLTILSNDSSLMRLTALGAVATSEALKQAYGLSADIKWPNDVLVQRRKIAGVLAEASWQGDTLKAVILGIGVNITHKSIPPGTRLNFPATCLEDFLGKPVEQVELISSILSSLLGWRKRLNTPDFILNWQDKLAFKGEWVKVIYPDNTAQVGIVQGLSPEGFLRLQLNHEETINIKGGDLHLRQLKQEQP